MNINRGFVVFKEPPPPSGIDKIQATSKEFQVKDATCLGVAPNHKKQGEDIINHTPLFSTNREIYPQPDGKLGNMVWGSRAYHNGPPEMGNLTINIDFRGCEIIYNPSKLLGKYSGELATPEEVHKTSVIIENYLSEIGISTNLSNYKLTRIDIAKDRLMDDKVFTYHQALNILDAKRMKEQVQYPDGMRLGNSSRQDCFYDKGLEIKPEDGSSNLMRGEYRLLKSDPVQKVLNISHLFQLKDISSKDISDIHSNHIAKDLYHAGDVNQFSFDFMSDVTLLKSFKGQGRNAFRRWVMVCGVEELVSTYGMEGIRKILQEVFDRSAVKKNMSEIRSLLQLNSFRSDKPTLSAKYEEIRTKFVA
jgi:hypothetical protein